MLVIVIVATIIIIALALYRIQIYYNGPSYMGPKQNLEGYIAIVTGGGGGIGMEVVKDLASQGCEVIIADIVNSEKVAAQINSELKKPKVSYIRLDLGNLQSIQDFVKQLKIDKLNFLINNAGVLGGLKISYTKSKFELHNGINYIGHFYLTHLLWSKLNKSNFFRVVIVSSVAHRKILGYKQDTTIQYGKFNFEDIPYNKDVAYSRSKLYLTMFAQSLAEITPKDKGMIVAIHPGIARTSMVTSHAFTLKDRIVIKLITPLFYLFAKSPLKAAQTILYAVYSDIKELKSGAYYADCALSTANPLVQTQHRKMFDITQETLGIKFGQN